MCSSSVLPSCSSQWRRDPLHSRFRQRHPVSYIQSTDWCPSTKPSTSTLSNRPARRAHRQMFFTESRSPSLTRADATSMRSIFKSCNNARAMTNFSWGMKLTPLVCSPSRSVVSMISTFLSSGSPMLLSYRCSQAGSRCRRGHSLDNTSYSRSARSARSVPS